MFESDPLNAAKLKSSSRPFLSFLGFTLLLAGLLVLHQNERSLGRRVRLQSQVKENLTKVPLERLLELVDGSLILVSAPLVASQPLLDPVFGIKSNHLALRRSVKIYLWSQVSTEIEKSESQEKVKNYKYEKVWTEELIDSTNFKEKSNHQNPNAIPYKQETFWPESARIGKFNINIQNLIGEVTWKPLPVTQVAYETVPDTIKKRFATNGLVLQSWSSGGPEIGALEIYFSELEEQTVTILAQKTKDRLLPWKTQFGEVFVVKAGQQTEEAMLNTIEETDKSWTWACRILSLFLLILSMAAFSANRNGSWIAQRLIPEASAPNLVFRAILIFLATLAATWASAMPIYSWALLATIAGLILIKGLLTQQRPS